MKKNILLAAILINQINVKGMEGEKIEEPGILIKKDNKSILYKLGSGINNYKKEIAGCAGGAAVGYGGGRLIEHLTETTNEKREITSGWWSRELTYGLSLLTAFASAALIGRISGKKIGIEIGCEQGKKEASELFKEKIIKKYYLKIEAIEKGSDVSKIKRIADYLELIKETENE